MIGLHACDANFRIVKIFGRERTREIFAVSLLGIGLADVPKEELYGAFGFADVAIFILALQLGVSESVKKRICVIGGLGNGLRVDESEASVERFGRRAVFFKDIRVGPIRKNIGKAFASFDGAQNIRGVIIAVVNGIRVRKRA